MATDDRSEKYRRPILGSGFMPLQRVTVGLSGDMDSGMIVPPKKNRVVK